MMGLGDGIFQRAFVKNYPGAYLETPWPAKNIFLPCLHLMATDLVPLVYSEPACLDSRRPRRQFE
ncbi:hypothetical protein D9D06_13280 [Pseudomonas aeruginosa]|nr:hypothetical protein D9D06_13280 [Pseudomonas aeruginosa]